MDTLSYELLVDVFKLILCSDIYIFVSIQANFSNIHHNYQINKHMLLLNQMSRIIIAETTRLKKISSECQYLIRVMDFRKGQYF